MDRSTRRAAILQITPTLFDNISTSSLPIALSSDMRENVSENEGEDPRFTRVID